MPRITTTIDGHEVSFTRRRYGNRTTFTWASVKLGENWVDLGDPWQCVTPPRAEVRREIARALAERQTA